MPGRVPASAETVQGKRHHGIGGSDGQRYFLTGVMERVRETSHPMLMLVVKHDNIKSIMRKFDSGGLDATST